MITIEMAITENTLSEQLATTEAIVWSPQTDSQSIQALSDLLVTAQAQTNADKWALTC
jgi:hypothetical protein